MNEKQCTKCGETKSLDCFMNDKRGRLGKQAQCKVCKSAQDKAYRDRKGRELLDKKSEYYAKNKEAILKQQKEYAAKPEVKAARAKRYKEYRAKNLDVIKAKSKAYYQKNKERIKKKSMENYYKNPQKAIQRNIRYERERRQKDPTFRLMLNVKNTVYKALVRQNGGKFGSKTLDSLPYTIKELKEHLEKQFDEHMTWENYGSYWHVDHIYPQSKLPYKSLQEENFLKCWSLDNLRPLEAVENMQKSDKIIKVEKKVDNSE